MGMLKEVLEKLQNRDGGQTSFDPASLNDAVAMQTAWTPAKRGGANFQTHRLVNVNPDRLEFRASAGAKLLYLGFVLVGAGVLIFFLLVNLTSDAFSFTMETAMPLVVGLVLAAAGGCLFHFGTAPVVFDKNKGSFWKGRKAPAEAFDSRSLKYVVELEQIHALQLISERCRGNKSSYYSYELNLVLKNSRRINVVDHGNREKLREDTAILSVFLNRPVWDAT